MICDELNLPNEREPAGSFGFRITEKELQLDRNLLKPDLLVLNWLPKFNWISHQSFSSLALIFESWNFNNRTPSFGKALR